MMRSAFALLFVFFLAASLSCEKHEINQVPIEQIEPDSTNNYRYIFKDLIQKDNARLKKRNIDEFKD